MRRTACAAVMMGAWTLDQWPTPYLIARVVESDAGGRVARIEMHHTGRLPLVSFTRFFVALAGNTGPSDRSIDLKTSLEPVARIIPQGTAIAQFRVDARLVSGALLLEEWNCMADTNKVTSFQQALSSKQELSDRGQPQRTCCLVLPRVEVAEPYLPVLPKPRVPRGVGDNERTNRMAGLQQGSNTI